MIPLKRVDHIAMAAADYRAQAARLEKLFGFKFLHAFESSDPADFSGCVSQVPGTQIEFEVISPNGPKNFVQRFLDEEGPGLHHITMEVEDIHAAAAELERLGIKPFGGIQDDGMWHLTYVHPKDSGGVLYQLFVSHVPPRDEDRSTPSGGICGVKRVDHVSAAVRDLDQQIAFQERVFGMELASRWTDDQLGYHGAVMRIPGSLLEFEMIQASRPDSFVQRFIDGHRPGMHHVCIEVESVDHTVEALKAEGIEAFGGIVESDWHRHTFLHPRDSGGVLFQLFEE